MAENKDVVITDDMLNKALETLGLLTPEANDFSKGEDNAHKKAETDTEEKKEQATGDKDKKDGKGDKKPNINEDDDEIEKAISKASKEYEDMEKACSMKKAELEAIVGKRKKKNEKEPNFEKSEISDLIKSEMGGFGTQLGEVTNSVKVVVSSLMKENDDLKKSMSEMADALNKVTGVVTAIGNQSLGRKSIITSNAIEKSFGSDLGNTAAGKTQMSLSKDKAKLEETLLELAAFESNSPNLAMANAASLLNTSGMMNKSIENDLFQNHNIQIVP